MGSGSSSAYQLTKEEARTLLVAEDPSCGGDIERMEFSAKGGR